MDGTLVDTEPAWIDAEFALAGRYGATWSVQDALYLVGHDLLDAGRYIRERMELSLTPEEIVDELLDSVILRLSQGVPWRPGARELLAGLADAEIPCALVTMSYRRFVTPILAALPERSFSAVVTGDEITRGKPHPDPYLQAAALLGVPAADCLAIEDSETGTRAAEAAGCTVLVVPHQVAVTSGARRVFADSLTEVEAAALPGLVGAGSS